MASNRIPRELEPLIALAEDAADGAHNVGAEIELALNTEAKIRADLADLTGDPEQEPPVPGKQNLYTAARTNKVAKSALKRTAESNARAFCAKAIGVLKNHLGTEWNNAWFAAGFTTPSLAVPDDPLPLLGQLRAHFTANAAHENAPLNVTAAQAQAQLTAVSDARSVANTARQALATAKAARDASQQALYERMTGLRAELEQLLDDDDPHWYDFGFDRPADGQQPGPVTHLVLVPGSAGMVFADWDDARRAERYRVLKQVAAVDPEPVEVANAVTESEFTLTGLPSGATVQVTIVPVNDAGDGSGIAVGSIVVP